SRSGRICLLGSGDRVCWKLAEMGERPYHVTLLPDNTLLVAERSDKTLTRRRINGTVLWKKKLIDHDSVVNFQSLVTGNIFIATETRLMEVNSEGQAVSSYNL